MSSRPSDRPTAGAAVALALVLILPGCANKTPNGAPTAAPEARAAQSKRRDTASSTTPVTIPPTVATDSTVAAVAAPGPPSIPPLDPPAADTIPPFANPAATPVAHPAATVDRQGNPMFPLTGLPAPSADAAGEAVLAVKIDNAAPARPQTGLDHADVIIEEVVEGGVTRFLALFQSQGSDPIGPIRSVRPVDPALLAPFGGAFAYSGGTKRFINGLHREPIADVGVDLLPSAYFRGTQAKAPYNLYSRTSALRAAMGATRAPEQPWTFLDPGAAWSAVGAIPTDTYELQVSKVTRVRWRWDPAAKAWERTTNGTLHVVRGGRAVVAENVVVIHVPYLDTAATDASHAPVPEPAVLGAGPATFLVDGMQSEGHWSKSAVALPFRFTDAKGSTVALRRGVTWVLLAPTEQPG